MGVLPQQFAPPHALVPCGAARRQRLSARPSQILQRGQSSRRQKPGPCRAADSAASPGVPPASQPEGSTSPVLPRVRRLILLRHAKSSWDDPALMDHERPLSARGRKAAQSVAGKLAEAGWIPELILCSDALRTRQTLELMGAAVDAFKHAEVRFLGSFYSVAAMDGQTARHVHESVVGLARDAVGTVMCMGHNRGWEEAASEFAAQEVELKTANGALLQSRGPQPNWAAAFVQGWVLAHIVRPDPQ